MTGRSEARERGTRQTVREKGSSKTTDGADDDAPRCTGREGGRSHDCLIFCLSHLRCPPYWPNGRRRRRHFRPPCKERNRRRIPGLFLSLMRCCRCYFPSTVQYSVVRACVAGKGGRRRAIFGLRWTLARSSESNSPGKGGGKGGMNWGGVRKGEGRGCEVDRAANPVYRTDTEGTAENFA